MAFIYEIVPEKDYEFFRSMGLKNCWGNDSLTLSEGSTKWCADRERNVYVVGIGGGFGEVPHFHDLWWNGHIIRMETISGGNGNYDVGVEIIWFINKILIPREMWDLKKDIVKMINEAFSINNDWCKTEYLKSIHVKIDCEPTILED